MDFSTDNLKGFSQDLGSRLNTMNFKQKLYFSLSCIERVLPFYLHYARGKGMEKLDELSATIESYWGLSDFPIGALVRAEIPSEWATTDKEVGVVSGEAINLFMDYMNHHDNRLIQHVSSKMITVGELLTMKIGDNYVGDELELQTTAIGDAEKLDTDDAEALNDYITRSIQLSSNISGEIITKIH